MFRTRLSLSLVLSTWIAAAALLSAAALAQGNAPEYQVTIYNLTRAQVLSPPIVVTHSRDVALYQVGQPALPELALLAEDGDAGPLGDLLSGLAEVRDVAIAGGPVPPGASISVTLRGEFPYHRISVASMLVNTNDAFFGLDTVTAPQRRFQTLVFYANAFDAGSEANNEDCDFIPGPACAGAGAGVRDEVDAEGFVHVHPGIHGIADLDAAAYDWRNPSARIVITRVR